MYGDPFKEERYDLIECNYFCIHSDLLPHTVSPNLLRNSWLRCFETGLSTNSYLFRSSRQWNFLQKEERYPRADDLTVESGAGSFCLPLLNKC
ncbi:MAG: hypothetical protein K0Q73_8736 [Paenibacillus sp.]|nr:hypothetical protein [Paenibacillus sp.]